MRGDPEVIALLNEQLTSELTAVHQLWQHAAMQQSAGFVKLAARTCEDATEEQHHATKLAARILQLGGLPDYTQLFTVRTGRTVPDQFQADLAMELEVVGRLNTAITTCGTKGDNASADLLTNILVEEEEHIDWLESQLALINTVGEQIYLGKMITVDPEFDGYTTNK